MEARKRPEADWAAIRAEAMSEMIGLGFSDEQAAAEARRIEARGRARLEYGFALIDRLKAAQEALDAAWFRFLDDHPEYCTGGAKEDEDCDFEPPEQAEVKAVLAELDAVLKHGRYPKHLHFRDV